MKKIIKYQKLIFSISLIAVVFLYQQNLYSQDKKDERLPRPLEVICDDLVITAELLTDEGCCIEITFNHIWSITGPPYPNIFTLPHGILIEINSPDATISAATTSVGGGWFNGSTDFWDPSGNDKWVMWSKEPIWVGSNTPNALPSGQDLIITLCINANQDDPIKITVMELEGWAFPNKSEYWRCPNEFEFGTPSIPYTITAVPESICKGEDGIITLTPAPPPGSNISWYSYTADPNCPPFSTGLWTELTTDGGLEWPTNPLNSTTCYIAVIDVDDGCFSYIDTTNVATVTVCDPNIGGITATGTPITTIDEERHRCEHGQWNLSLPPINCPSTITWEKWDGSNWISGWGDFLLINTGGLPYDPLFCATEYKYRATIDNACGQIIRNWNIIIDAPTQPGTITADTYGTGTPTEPILCYEGATILTYSGGCGEIVEWQSSTDGGPTWLTIPDAGESSEYWTNKLPQTMWYRVEVQNGACDAEFSDSIKVVIKPLLTASITSDALNLCNPPVTITAETSYDNYPDYTDDVTYQWFLNGELIPNEINLTISTDATQYGAGNYYVMVYDVSCKDSAKSNIIKICPAPIAVIAGPSCFCEGSTITLSGSLLLPIRPKDCPPPSNCTYTWTGPGGTYTGATITVGLAGTYYLVVNCPDDGCTAETSIVISYCPVGDCL